MNSFVMGMNTIGQLFPIPYPYLEYPLSDSQWDGVANSFYQAGNSLRYVLKEISNEQQGKQTPSQRTHG